MAENELPESFYQLLKRIRRRTYVTRDAAKQDVFDYIEMFYYPTRQHTTRGMLSPAVSEIRQKTEQTL
jgi:putative transposase